MSALYVDPTTLPGALSIAGALVAGGTLSRFHPAIVRAIDRRRRRCSVCGRRLIAGPPGSRYCPRWLAHLAGVVEAHPAAGPELLTPTLRQAFERTRAGRISCPFCGRDEHPGQVCERPPTVRFHDWGLDK